MLLTTTASIAYTTQPGFLTLQGIYPSMKKEFEAFYDKTINTDRRQLPTAELRMMGPARQTQEGADAYSDTLNQKGQKTFFMDKYTLAISVTEEALADNLYKDLTVPQYGQAFVQSHIERQNLSAFKVLNEGWTKNNRCWDNLGIFDMRHPYDLGVQSNTLPNAAPVHEQSFNKIMSLIYYMRAVNGIPIPENSAEKFMVSPVMLPQATILQYSPTRPGTNSLELNPINKAKYFDQDFVVSRYILPNAVFLRTSVKGLRHFLREAMKTVQATDPTRLGLIISSFMRDCYGVDNFRSVYGFRSTLVQGI